MENNLGDIILLRGAIEFQLASAKTGEVIQSGRIENTVASNGRKWILNRIASSDANTIDRIYLGTGTTAPASTQTALVASATSRSAGTISTAGTSADPPYCTFAASWASNETFTSSNSISEFGLFGANATMIGRVTTATPINFATSNTLAITYTLSN